MNRFAESITARDCDSPPVSAVPRWVKKSLWSGALALVLGGASVELALRHQGTYSTYPERNFGQYFTNYGCVLDSWTLDHGRNVQRVNQSAEFAIECNTNGDGVRDMQHPVEAPDGVYRIVVLGDSFVEGVGAEREGSWTAQLEGLLRAQNHPVEIFNAGVSGSDPCFGYQLLADRFLVYRPDLVVFSLNSSDIDDTLTWGGMERFQANGTTRALPLPRLEPLYRRSHLFRLIAHRVMLRDSNLRSLKRVFHERYEAQLKLVEALVAARDLGRVHGFEVLVFLHPVPHEIFSDRVIFYEPFTLALQQEGLETFDLFGPLREKLGGRRQDSFSWLIDGHYNECGYSAMAEVAADALIGSGRWSALVSTR
jgi:hypothetical protein